MQARARAHDDDNVLNSSVDFFSAALYAGRISSVRIIYAGVSERERKSLSVRRREEEPYKYG